MEKELEKLKKSYEDLKQDYEAVSINTTETLRIGGYYKLKYYEYRETIQKLAEVLETSTSIKEVWKKCEERGIKVSADDKPVLVMYDKEAGIKNE